MLVSITTWDNTNQPAPSSAMMPPPTTRVRVDWGWSAMCPASHRRRVDHNAGFPTAAGPGRRAGRRPLTPVGRPTCGPMPGTRATNAAGPAASLCVVDASRGQKVAPSGRLSVSALCGYPYRPFSGTLKGLPFSRSSPVADGPLIVQSDKTLLLEVDHPDAQRARMAIAPFAELERSPEHVHTYRLTPLGLWNARAAGHDAEQVVDTLLTFSRYPVPHALLVDVAETMARYGRLRLQADPAYGLVLASSDRAV